METITKFKAIDGREFKDEADCIKHEACILGLKTLFASMPAKPKDDGCSFANGGGYIQHDAHKFRFVQDMFYAMACKYHKGLEQHLYDSYGFWRTLDDSGSPFYGFGQRLLNTDNKTYREYGQGYYKINPDKVTGGKLN